MAFDDGVQYQQTITEERHTRPRFKYNNDTHLYWHRTLNDAYQRLDIQERAQKAKEDKRWLTYDLRDRTVNLVSQKLVAKAVNIITDYPQVTPMFREMDEEMRWFDIATALVKREWMGCDAKNEFAAILWDNFYADVAWGKVSFETQFSPGQVIRPGREKQLTIQQEQQIKFEHSMAFGGGALLVGPQDFHELHRQRHEDFINELTPLVDAGQIPPLALQTMELHLDQHRQALTPTARQRIVYQRWPSYLVYYDPAALRWADCEWYAIELVERREAMMANKLYRRVGALQGQILLEDDPYHDRDHYVIGRQHGDGAPEETHIRHWLIHSRVDDLMIVIAQQERPDQEPLLVEKWPYPGDVVAPFVLNPVNDRVHGVSEIERMRLDNEQIEALDKKMHIWAKDVPIAKRLLKGKFAADQNFKRILGDPRQINVPVASVEEKIVENIDYPAIDPNIFQRYQMLVDRLNQVVGTPDQIQAQTTGRKETATEIAARDRQFGATIQQAKSRLADHIRWVCEQIVDIWRENGTVDQMVRVVGDRSRLHWEQFTPADLPYEIRWLVDPDSLAPTARDLAKKQTMEIFEKLTPLVGPILDPYKMAAIVLRRLDLVEEPSELFVGYNPYPQMQGAMMGGMQPMLPGMPSVGRPEPPAPDGQVSDGTDPMMGTYTGAEQGAGMAM